MAITKFKAGAVILLASCLLAGITISATSRGRVFQPDGKLAVRAASTDRLFKPDGKLVYVIISSTADGVNRNFLHNFVAINILPEINRFQGLGAATMLGNRGSEMRITLDPDLMRANHLSPEDIKRAFSGCSLIGSSEGFAAKSEQAGEYDLTYLGRYDDPQQYANIILRANPDGEILRLKDVGRAELGASFADISSDSDGHPAAAFVLKSEPGSDIAGVVKVLGDHLTHRKAECFPPGIDYRIISPDSSDIIYAVIQTPPDSLLETMSARCHELDAIARGIAGVASVSSLAGYEIRTEGRDSNVGTCLIQLQDQPDRKRVASQIIDKLKARCRTINADIEWFESPAVSVFVASGGFAIRILDRSTASHGEQPDRNSEERLDNLMNHKPTATLLRFLVSHFAQDELVINNDVARQNGVNIVTALESRFQVVGDGASGQHQEQRLVENFSDPSCKNDRGAMVSTRSILQLKKKPGLSEIDR